jgi:hypothetical protein
MSDRKVWRRVNRVPWMVSARCPLVPRWRPDNCVAANVLAACFIIDLPDLGGAEKIRKLGVPVRTLVGFEGH